MRPTVGGVAMVSLPKPPRERECWQQSPGWFTLCEEARDILLRAESKLASLGRNSSCALATQSWWARFKRPLRRPTSIVIASAEGPFGISSPKGKLVRSAQAIKQSLALSAAAVRPAASRPSRSTDRQHLCSRSQAARQWERGSAATSHLYLHSYSRSDRTTPILDE